MVLYGVSSKYVFKFNAEFLNEHRALADQSINVVICPKCNQAFKKGDWLFSKPTTGGKQKRYHLKCAFKALLVTRKEVAKYRAVYIMALGLWACELGRQLFVSQ